MNLSTYLADAINRLRKTPSIDLFIDLRYYELGKLFPHDVFAVAQASADFFDEALSHLNGQPFDKTDGEPSLYEANYRRWIIKHRP